MFLTRAANLFLDAALAVVYPQSCVICSDSVESRSLGIVCQPCWDRARIFKPDEAECWKCGTPLSAKRSAPPEQLSCRGCEDQPFSAARACGVYEGALRATVLGLKREPYLPSRLAELLDQRRRCTPMDRATLIVPVPLHRSREKLRGFNQAMVIGEALERLTATPLARQALVRTVHTKRHRGGMDEKARRETVANAFKVEQPRHIAGERILLVDDVFTTGATASACTIELLAAGASEVFVLTIARSA